MDIKNNFNSVDELPVFDWCVSPDLQVHNEERIIEARFGDGYSQRAKDGIHSLIRTFNVELTRKTEDAKPIIEFLRERGQIEAFRWTIPITNETVIVRCTEWTITIDNTTIKISATFKELVGESKDRLIPDLPDYPEYDHQRKILDIVTNLQLSKKFAVTSYAAERKNTGNPIPSNYLADLNDNTIIIDEFSNSQADQTLDRFSKPMPTLAKLVKDWQASTKLQTDYTQTDSSKPDYLKGRENIFPKSGGDINGNINVKGTIAAKDIIMLTGAGKLEVIIEKDKGDKTGFNLKFDGNGFSCNTVKDGVVQKRMMRVTADGGVIAHYVPAYYTNGIVLQSNIPTLEFSHGDGNSAHKYVVLNKDFSWEVKDTDNKAKIIMAYKNTDKSLSYPLITKMLIGGKKVLTEEDATQPSSKEQVRYGRVEFTNDDQVFYFDSPFTRNARSVVLTAHDNTNPSLIVSLKKDAPPTKDGFQMVKNIQGTHTIDYIAFGD